VGGIVDLFSHDTGKTANIIHRNIYNNKTANIKGKIKRLQRRVRSTIRISHN